MRQHLRLAGREVIGEIIVDTRTCHRTEVECGAIDVITVLGGCPVENHIATVCRRAYVIARGSR